VVTQRTEKKRRLKATLRGFARAMRKAPTDAERKLWWKLKDRRLGGLKFKRQYPIVPFIVDFVCIEKRVVVELDGSQHQERAAYDAARDAFLARKGFRVVRIWNADFLRHQDETADYIFRVLGDTAPSPQPSPPMGARG
jgi:very-short-patch-repair endonuclease